MADMRVYKTGKQNGDFAIDGGKKGWTSPANSKDSLQTLANDLEVGIEIDFNRSDVSVPSPWASVLIFDMLLQNKDNQFKGLEEQALNEWRSLIFAVATYKLYGNYLSFKTIDLTEDSVGSVDREFYHNLMDLKPKTCLFGENTSWNKFTFLQVEGHTIGVLTDSMLVCSCNNYDSETIKKLIELGLYKNNYGFINPVEVIKEDYSLAVYMYSWLYAVKRKLSQIKSDENSEAVNSLTNMLLKYQEDISNALDDSIKDALRTKFCNEELPFLKFSFNKESFENATEFVKSIYLMQLNFREDTGIYNFLELEDYRIFMMEGFGKKLEDIYSLAEKEGRIERPDDDDHLLIGSAQLFTDKMAMMEYDEKKVFDSDESIEYSYVDESKTEKTFQIIYPIKYEILKNIKSEDIIRNSEFEKTDTSISLSVRFKLKAGGGARYVTLKKTYKRDSDIVELKSDADIAVAIYPYCKITEREKNVNLCKEYHAYIVYDAGGEYKLELGCANTDEKSYIEHGPTIIQGKFGTSDVTLTKYNNFPDYIRFSKNVTNSQQTKMEYGVYLLPEPKTYTVGKETECTIGVDMGTSSTTVFASIDNVDGNNAKFIRFGKMENDGIISDTNIYGNDEKLTKIVCCTFKYDKNIYLSFVPNEYVPRRSYPSAIRGYVSSKTDNFTDYPFFFGSVMYNQIDKATNAGDVVYSNFKWGESDDEDKALQSYLGQIMRASVYPLLEKGVGVIKWRFSYPSSLPEEGINKYKNRTRTICESLSKEFGITSKYDKDHCYFPESIVAAKYYSRPNTYLCIDIGGGSTDVSMWRPDFGHGLEPENIMQFSIGLASRKIFMKALQNLLFPEEGMNAELFEDAEKIRKSIEDRCSKVDGFVPLLNDSTYAKIEKITDKKTKAQEFINMYEPLLQLYGNDIRKDLESSFSNSNGFVNMQRFLTAGVWSIMYYILLVINAHKDEILEATDGKINTLSIVFAGNGSRIYSWVRDQFEGKMKKAFESELEKIFGIKIHIDELALEEEKLKTEAAAGLIKMGDVKDSDMEGNHEYLVNGDTSKIYFYKSEGNDPIELSPVEDIKSNEYICSMLTKENPRRVEHTDTSFEFDENDSLMKFINMMNEKIFNGTSALMQSIKVDESLKEAMDWALGEVSAEGIASRVCTPAFIMKVEAFIKILPKILGGGKR